MDASCQSIFLAIIATYGGRWGMTDPFHITGPALISFSGGRTSAYMLWRILQAHGGTLPDDVHVTFANTGKEREETLRFVHDCATHWNVRVRWLEWRSRLKSVPIAQRFEEVGFNSASRNGEPFAALIASKKSTPNSVARWCTEELKVRTLQTFMEAEGYGKDYANVVGLRADEMHRVLRGRERGSVMPLADAGITKRMVRAFWDAQPFDLQLLPFEGNCDACFLKGRAKLWEVERTAPGTMQWWSDMEAIAGGTFTKEYSYAELIRDVRRQPDLFAGGLFDDDPEMDAECGTWCAGEAA
jgi:3'-phosphoadenosine 5'-phosphosulfate sulfotransferase (PAPS reductase)/FAD synthetase